MLENELAQMVRTWMATVEQTADAETAHKICYAAGLAHGRRRLGTFLAGHGSAGGVDAMAAWQDTSHSSAGARHASFEFVDRPDFLLLQDDVAQCAQGVIQDRSAERLGRSDVAVVMLRKLWTRELVAEEANVDGGLYPPITMGEVTM